MFFFTSVHPSFLCITNKCSHADKAMLCRYFCNSLGSPWIRIRKTTSQNEHPPCQAREPAHALCGSHCVYAKFDCVALCKEKSIIGFRARKSEKIFAKLQTRAIGSPSIRTSEINNFHVRSTRQIHASRRMPSHVTVSICKFRQRCFLQREVN